MRRRTTVLLSGIVLSTVLAANASAAPPAGLATYAAGSTAHAVLLDADVLSTSLLVSQTVANVGSTGPTATAGGAALVVGGEVFGGPSETCPLTLEPPADAAVTDIGCLTLLEEADADPRAASTSDEVIIELGGSQLSNQALTPLRDAVVTQLGAAVGGLAPVLALIPGGTLPDLQAAIDAVLNTLVDPAGATVRITQAPTNATASADQDGVVARSAAAGLILEVVPALFGAPVSNITTCDVSNALLCAQIAGSVAQVRRDPVTAAATTEATEARLVAFRVAPQLGTLLAGALNQVADALNAAVAQLAAGSPLACGQAGPLAALICIDGAATQVLDAAQAATFGFAFGEGTVGSRASGLRVEVLPAAQGGIGLALNEAVAAANASVIVIPRGDPEIPTTTAAPPSLARTGGGGVSPMAAVLMLGAGLGATVLVRRSRPSVG